MNDYTTIDANGQFVWSGAPDTPVMGSVFKRGYVRGTNQPWTAGTEVKIELAESPSMDGFDRPAVLTARSTVLDAKTGRPVENSKCSVNRIVPGSTYFTPSRWRM